MNKIATLPEFFLISAKNYNKNPLWPEYINWLNEKYSSTFDGDNTNVFYGVNNNVPLCISKEHAFYGKFISIYQWYAAVNNVPDFTIPGTQIGDCIGLEYGTMIVPVFYSYELFNRTFVLYSKKVFINKNEICIAADENFYKGKNYFVFRLKDIIKKYKKEEKMGRELIGYKIKPKYIEAFIKLFDAKLEKEFYLNETFNCQKDSPSCWKAKNLNILDIWFEKIYKKSFKLPKINGYEGIFDKDNQSIEYGCAKFPFVFLRTIFNNIINFNKLVDNNKDRYNRTIQSIELSSGVKISIENLNDIIKFLENN